MFFQPDHVKWLDQQGLKENGAVASPASDLDVEMGLPTNPVPTTPTLPPPPVFPTTAPFPAPALISGSDGTLEQSEDDPTTVSGWVRDNDPEAVLTGSTARGGTVHDGTSTEEDL